MSANNNYSRYNILSTNCLDCVSKMNHSEYTLSIEEKAFVLDLFVNPNVSMRRCVFSHQCSF